MRRKISIITKQTAEHVTKHVPGSKAHKRKNKTKVETDFQVPMYLLQASKEIEERGIEVEGIFRVPGLVEDVKVIIKAWSKGKSLDLQKIDIHTVASAFKQFFRNLPEPLLTYELYEAFITATSVTDPEDRLTFIEASIKKLPVRNRELLKHLVRLLHKISKRSDVNQMTAANLAIVFTPSLLRPEKETIEQMFGKAIQSNRLIETFVEEYDVLFAGKQRKRVAAPQKADQAKVFYQSLRAGTLRIILKEKQKLEVPAPPNERYEEEYVDDNEGELPTPNEERISIQNDLPLGKPRRRNRSCKTNSNAIALQNIFQNPNMSETSSVGVGVVPTISSDSVLLNVGMRSTGTKMPLYSPPPAPLSKPAVEVQSASSPSIMQNATSKQVLADLQTRSQMRKQSQVQSTDSVEQTSKQPNVVFSQQERKRPVPHYLTENQTKTEANPNSLPTTLSPRLQELNNLNEDQLSEMSMEQLLTLVIAKDIEREDSDSSDDDV